LQPKHGVPLSSFPFNFGWRSYNLASGVPTRLGELIGAVEAAVGGTPADVTELPQRAADVGGTYADVSAAKRVLGWAAELSLEVWLMGPCLFAHSVHSVPVRVRLLMWPSVI